VLLMILEGYEALEGYGDRVHQGEGEC
jgi:hypothetical protein